MPAPGGAAEDSMYRSRSTVIGEAFVRHFLFLSSHHRILSKLRLGFLSVTERKLSTRLRSESLSIRESFGRVPPPSRSRPF